MTLTQEEHYQEFLKRIPTREAFRAEVEGKLKAVQESGFPHGLDDNDIDMFLSLVPLNTLGKPQFWPPET